MTTRTDHNTGMPATKAGRLPAWTGRVALALGALGLLAGCEGVDRAEFKPGCPNVAIVRDAGSLRSVAADGSVTASLVMSNLQAICEYDDTGVTVSATLTIRVTPIEGGKGGTVPVEYFVAVTDPNRVILAKQIFVAQADAGSVNFIQEDLVQFIPAPKTVDARYYEVLVGFQLPPEQGEANRRANDAR
jgi:hypothetical protein